MERGQFIRLGCAACSLVAIGALPALFSGCTSFPVFKTTIAGNIIRVAKDQLVNSAVIVRVHNLDSDILVYQKSETEYVALLMLCTHADNSLAFTGKKLTCNLHGSTFNLDGDVTTGPATKPLKKYPVSIQGTELLITIR